MTVVDAAGLERTFAIALVGTPFYVGGTLCVPGALAVGAEIDVAYHFDADGAVVSDAAMLVSSA